MPWSDPKAEATQVWQVRCGSIRIIMMVYDDPQVSIKNSSGK